MKSALFSAGIAVVIATPLAAQTPAPSPDSSCNTYPGGRTECRIFRRGMPGDSAFRSMTYRMDSVMANRAALGIELRATGTRRDTLGVFVEAVTPKGPAESAGIVEGDRIAAINGVDLRTSAGDIDDPYTNGLASHRLSREVRKLTPGARVTLRVYSGGRFRDVQLIAGKASEVMRFGNHFDYRMLLPDGPMEFGPEGAMMFGSPMPFPLSRSRIELRGPGEMRELLPLMHPRVLRIRRPTGTLGSAALRL